MKLSINTPCHENWANMQPAEQGRFCTACQKEVLDFTNVPFPTIKHFFEVEKGAVCGRLHKHQLEAFNSYYQPLPTPSKMKQWAAAAVLTAVVSLPCLGQNTPTTLIEHPIPTNQVAPKQQSSKTANCDTKLPKMVMLSGKVYNTELDEPMSFTNILIVGTEIGTSTDIDGKFSLEVPYSDKPITLKVSHLDFEPVLTTIVPNQSREQLIIEVKMSVQDMDLEAYTRQLKMRQHSDEVLLGFVTYVSKDVERATKKELRRKKRQDKKAMRKKK